MNLSGAACARLSLAVQAGPNVTPLGELGMRVEDLSISPDELSDLDGWYVSAPR